MPCVCVPPPKELPNAGAALLAGVPKVEPKTGAVVGPNVLVEPKAGGALVGAVPKAEPNAGVVCVCPNPKLVDCVVAGWVELKGVAKPVAERSNGNIY